MRAALAQGLDWKELERLIETETRAGNPVAGMVESLRLDVGRVTLLLSNDLDEEECDEDALARPATRVSIHLAPQPAGPSAEGYLRCECSGLQARHREEQWICIVVIR